MIVRLLVAGVAFALITYFGIDLLTPDPLESSVDTISLDTGNNGKGGNDDNDDKRGDKQKNAGEPSNPDATATPDADADDDDADADEVERLYAHEHLERIVLTLERRGCADVSHAALLLELLENTELRRHVGDIGDAHQHHFRGRRRPGRGLHLGDALEQHLPHPRQHPHR